MIKPPCFSRQLAFSTMTFMLDQASMVHAQAVPDAGAIMRELRQVSPAAQSPASPPRQSGEPSVEGAESDIRIAVTGFNITGNTSIPTDELQDLLTDQLGRRLNLAELKSAAARLTSLYRERGLPVARAYLPVQDVQGGKVEIRILEGNISQLRLRNASSLSDERAQVILNRAVAGSAIRSADVDRNLLLLNDVPGVPRMDI